MAAFVAAISCAPQFAYASTYDSGAGAGIQAGSATWDFNTTSNWTTDSGASRVNWTNNSDLASFQLQGNAGTVTIGATQVGTGGLTFSGTVGSTSSLWTMGLSAGTNSIQLGAGGITNQISDGFLKINAPLVLTASQTWTSTRLAANNGAAGVQVVGAISSVSGATNLTFDGLGLSDPTGMGNTVSRVTFDISGANTFTGTTTVTGGAVLRLNYGSQNNSKLDDNSALILKGGSVVLNSGSNTIEVVASTTVDSGANTIFAGSSGGGTNTGTGVITNKIQLGALTHNISGTLDITNAVSGIAATTTGNTNGIIGGWATLSGSWAVGSADGSTSTNITSTAGTTDNTPATWTTTKNVNVSSTSAVSVTTSKTINALRFNGANGGISIDPAATVQVNSGGIIAAASGQSITGGKITTGQSSGELFVHTPNAFTIGSDIADNGSTPTILVKAGSNSLTLTGANTYTGATYVNSATLAIVGGSLANGNVFVRGAATFTMNSTSAITFNLAGTNAGQFDVFTQDAGGLLTLGGTMNLKFNSTFTSGASFDLFNLSSGSADGFTTISIAGSYMGSITEGTPGLWSGTIDGQVFTFTESSGLLNIAAIPEPSAYALIFGSLAIGMIAVVRRRRG
ncbi:MAG: autotransporter-associated beta strand repeat-containing protein [Opitutaceae bacterium]|jgi:autotransporter-associated beta strand protein